ncbi:hypothetical protein OEZ60_16535 [Defluviimonas sp. WL0024]|uniref:Uncharacterized protein n=2 Tax=Albidovulum TaxID=205889 RepID=A0ABT3J5V3_9RHOB|nr:MULTISPECIES: hypothetical protein [Defluviimonas]MCU9849608.1 hypothetical protein [Defluviimonas sp. WL0024]MCW3783059.1 hypothetical protein [Defluviimonas salinarum]
MDDIREQLETLLVEDVILTLGNLRGSLTWLMADETGARSPRGIGIDRLDRQLALVEDRARSVCRLLRSGRMASEYTGGPGDAGETRRQPPETDDPFPRCAAAPEPGVTLETAILDALLHDRDAACLTMPRFRSQRSQS